MWDIRKTLGSWGLLGDVEINKRSELYDNNMLMSRYDNS